MKTNRDDVRLSLSEARERQREMDNRLRRNYSNKVGRDCNRCHEDPQDMANRKPGWTPAPDLASLRHSEPVKKPARDYEALTKAALRKPRTDNDALVDKFGGGVGPVSAPASTARAGSSPAAAPIPDGALRGDLVWPKWCKDSGSRIVRCDSEVAGEVIWDMSAGWPRKESSPMVIEAWLEMARGGSSSTMFIPQSEALAWLDANGHKAYADELRQPRKQVEGRVWKSNGGMFTWALIGDGAYLFGGPSKATEAWEKSKIVDAGELIECMRKRSAITGDAIELHGPEADVILRECASAMGLEVSTHG